MKSITPTLRIVADGADVTAKINDRLLLLRTSDKPGMDSDEFELRIDDRNGQVVLPRRGSSIEIYMGYPRNVPGAHGSLRGGHGRGIRPIGYDRDQRQGQRHARQRETFV